MHKLLFLACWLAVGSLSGQAIVNSNLNHQYNPNCEIQARLQVVRHDNRIVVFYALETVGNPGGLAAFSIKWEKRNNFSDPTGQLLTNDSITGTTANGQTGQLTFAVPEKPWLLVLAVTNTTNPRTYLFPRLIEANYPVQGVLLGSNEIIWPRFIHPGDEITYRGTPRLQRARVYRYPKVFPTASPPFVEQENRVDPLLIADSTFWLDQNQPMRYNTEGLYLIQDDTTQAQGLAFRVENETYPKVSRLADLAGPLIFITTREEYERIAAAGSNKAEFDKEIIGITRDKERAKTFMRSYYRRVELANLYFTSYKEGWKTDRGMIFLIFGLPDNVTYTGSTEVWAYRNYDIRFTFVKSGSIYSPDNFILVRNKRFAETWYGTIDLWRKARF